MNKGDVVNLTEDFEYLGVGRTSLGVIVSIADTDVEVKFVGRRGTIICQLDELKVVQDGEERNG